MPACLGNVASIARLWLVDRAAAVASNLRLAGTICIYRGDQLDELADRPVLLLHIRPASWRTHSARRGWRTDFPPSGDRGTRVNSSESLSGSMLWRCELGEQLAYRSQRNTAHVLLPSTAWRRRWGRRKAIALEALPAIASMRRNSAWCSAPVAEPTSASSAAWSPNQ